jgi:hypothetical protein
MDVVGLAHLVVETVQMMSHPWLSPSAAVVAAVVRARATAALRELGTVPLHRLGPHAPAWPRLLRALPGLLRASSERLIEAVGRVDVLAVLLDLQEEDPVDAGRLERALVTLWLGLAGHPGLTPPLALPGPFRGCVVDPHRPRLLALDGARGLIATPHGPAVIGHEGRRSLDAFVTAALPTANGTVIVDEQLGVPDPEVAARVQDALAVVASALPGGHLERVTIGSGEAARGDAACGEARVGPTVDPGDLVASAQAAFLRAAATVEPLLVSAGALVEHGRRLAPVDVLARASGNVVALPWRADRVAAARAIADDLDELTVLADLTPVGAELAAAIRAGAGRASTSPPRALLVNVDPDDFVYSFQFGRSVERRCVERSLRLDRIMIDPGWRRDLVAELGGSIPTPVADGTETLVKSQDDPAVAAALAHLQARRDEVGIANVRPRLFYDLLASGLLAGSTLLWDRHLHDGLAEERMRRGFGVDHLRGLPMRLWSLQGVSGPDLHPSVVEAGLVNGGGRPWPMDLEFFRSSVPRQAGRVFAGGDSGRDWPLFMEAIRDLPLDVHLVTALAPAEIAPPGLRPSVHVEARLPLARFRDAMAAATITAIPLLAGHGAAGVTVLTMAMALGVAAVVTSSSWITQYVTDGEEALLVPPGDVAAFRDAIVRLHEDAGLRERLVENARRRVVALCDLEAFTREMFGTLG